MLKVSRKNTRKLPFLLGMVCIGAVLVVWWASANRFNPVPQIIHATVLPKYTEQFPDINMSVLDGRQQRIMTLLRQEHERQNPGKKYSEGIDEPWCADFVSWIMKEAGMSLSNPNSGSWRIPGTYTLRDHYQSQGRFKPASSGYQPKIGDVVLYDNPSPFGQHTNIVVKNDNGVITTIGGNEPGGIRVYTHTKADKNGLVGYGVL